MLLNWAYGLFLNQFGSGIYFNAGMYLGFCFDYVVGFDPDF